MSRIYRKAERRCPGRVGSVFLQEKRKQKSADQAQRDLWEDHDQNQPMANSMVKGSETFAIRITGILVMELATNRLIQREE